MISDDFFRWINESHDIREGQAITLLKEDIVAFIKEILYHQMRCPRK
ncbi:hypothetical protein QG37_02892 [Candidozyma auris]|uniref:Uncharacterized protein n=1 Tax=Candidozyma auris TaxID=498019 RepID=A0A0L0P1R0_CANAR|nr:hypothetical protein QG37_02892 [[Candida] auris]